MGTNESLDLRCCAFPVSAQVKAEWSRCPGSMTRRAETVYSHAGKLSRLNVGENRKVVRWCTKQWTMKCSYDAIVVFRIETFVVLKHVETN